MLLRVATGDVLEPRRCSELRVEIGLHLPDSVISVPTQALPGTKSTACALQSDS